MEVEKSEDYMVMKETSKSQNNRVSDLTPKELEFDFDAKFHNLY